MAAIWDEFGYPQNQPAAMQDGAEWLKLMAAMMDQGRLTLSQHSENRRRLQTALNALVCLSSEERELTP